MWAQRMPSIRAIGIPIEQIIKGKSRNRVWLVLSVSFLFCFSLPYYQYSSSISSNNITATSPNDYPDSDSSKPRNLNYPYSIPNHNETHNRESNISMTASPPRVNEARRNFTDVSGGTTARVNRLSSMPICMNKKNGTDLKSKEDSCWGRYIYIHDLPNRFNNELLQNCRTLGSWVNFCPYVKNNGFGPQLKDSGGVISNKSWYRTDQFMLSVIFHNRMKKYECLTQNSSTASAIYVPFYAGLEIGRYLWGFNASVRDAAGLALVRWLREKPEWKALFGRDHFFVAGRINWDMRRDDNSVDWGSKLLNLPESKNMTMLTIESSPWARNDFAIPYPTYFHPLEENEVFEWQETVRRQERRYLFTFQGAPRPNMTYSIRNDLIDQCLVSRRHCNLVNCKTKSRICNDPVHVIRNFKNSVFCLQPPGDSFTRRSTFDSILAGCIPVFFHPGSTYIQYLWHFPKNYTKYSVFIPIDKVKNGSVSIDKVLSEIPKEYVLAMREEVIRLIPRISYARSKLRGIRDAFDISVKRILEIIEATRKKTREGKDPSNDFPEQKSWKYYLSGTTGKHEWDSYFET
ncbi:hypothetical protein Nepgr_009910 [Nepenthes gracilis]|uniref:Exostosin GT47 domain-containing protein n=1 Tax=Nepenthes gracilis TaxID=150966 RepID=A0AAD3XKU1_NEPGR|nr:hypothetical protein Nepgr_009910 [Nepenthes gracilis]